MVELKERLNINIELASPVDFVPVASDWQVRSPFIERHGRLSFHHFDLYAQALSKIERHHEQDVKDVEAMLRLGLIKPDAMLRYYERVVPELYRYPAIDEATLRRAVEDLIASYGLQGEEEPPSQGGSPP